MVIIFAKIQGCEDISSAPSSAPSGCWSFCCSCYSRCSRTIFKLKVISSQIPTKFRLINIIVVASTWNGNLIRRGSTHYFTNLIDKLLIEGLLAIIFIIFAAVMRVTLEHPNPLEVEVCRLHNI